MDFTLWTHIFLNADWRNMNVTLEIFVPQCAIWWCKIAFSNIKSWGLGKYCVSCQFQFKQADLKQANLFVTFLSPPPHSSTKEWNQLWSFNQILENIPVQMIYKKDYSNKQTICWHNLQMVSKCIQYIFVETWYTSKL